MEGSGPDAYDARLGQRSPRNQLAALVASSGRVQAHLAARFTTSAPGNAKEEPSPSPSNPGKANAVCSSRIDTRPGLGSYGYLRAALLALLRIRYPKLVIDRCARLWIKRNPALAGLLCHRAGRTRTFNPRFWRPVLCQLSYGPRRGA